MPPDREPPLTGPQRNESRRGLTRRQLLCAAPALATAWGWGCRPGPPPADAWAEIDLSGIEGEVVGASAAFGHRLRSGDLPQPGEIPPTEVREVPVVIAGGGIAGLSAGWKLAGSGFSDFVLLELESAPGGNARWGENGVSAYPWGAHYLPQPTRESSAVRELLEEMGLVVGHDEAGQPIYDPRHLCHAPQERLFTDDGWQPGISLAAIARPEDAPDIAAFEAQARRFRAARGADGCKAFALPMALSSEDATFRDLDRLSMRAFMDRAGWWSERLRWYVDYCCRDDYGCTLDTTSAWAGWHYFCARVEVDAFDRVTQRAVRYRAQRLIFALPRFLAPHVIAGYAPERAAGFTYCPWLVANLTVRQLPDQAAWDNVFYYSRSLGYVVATHQNLRMATGPSVLTYYLPFTDADPDAARRTMLKTGWLAWTARILADLSQAHPGIEALVRRVDIMLWGHAMIRPTPGFLFGQARSRASEPFGAVTFAHSDMSGLSLFEEAQYRGVAAAEDWLRDQGLRFTSSLGG